MPASRPLSLYLCRDTPEDSVDSNNSPLDSHEKPDDIAAPEEEEPEVDQTVDEEEDSHSIIKNDYASEDSTTMTRKTVTTEDQVTSLKQRIVSLEECKAISETFIERLESIVHGNDAAAANTPVSLGRASLPQLGKLEQTIERNCHLADDLKACLGDFEAQLQTVRKAAKDAELHLEEETRRYNAKIAALSAFVEEVHGLIQTDDNDCDASYEEDRQTACIRRIKELQTKLQDTANENELYLIEINTLRVTVAQIEEEYTKSKPLVESLESKNEILTKELEIMQSNVPELHSAFAQSQSECAEFKALVNTLKLQNETLTAERQQLVQENKQYLSDIDSLRSVVEQSESSCTELKTATITLKTKNETLERELETMQSKVSELQKTQQQLTNERNDITRNLNDARQEISSREAEIDKIKSELHSREQTIKSISETSNAKSNAISLRIKELEEVLYLPKRFRESAHSYVDGKGNLRFRDYGLWGTYVGDVDKKGMREGSGKIIYDDGGFYDGMFKNNKFHGKGVYRWSDGEEYDGQWKDNVRNGRAIFRFKDGTVEYVVYEAGKPVGEGVKWTPDRKTAYKLQDGEEIMEMLPEEADEFAKEMFDMSIPPPSKVSNLQTTPGIFGYLSIGGAKLDNDGKPMFNDNDEWGSWSGQVDSSNKRVGFGTMNYQSGAIYEGAFVNDVYEDDTGKSKYTWPDGEYYIGQWQGGERHGKGIFCSKDGSVEYSMYNKGAAAGYGLKWSADRKTAFRLVDGKQSALISFGVARKEAKEKFGLPVPDAKNAPKSDAKPTYDDTLTDDKDIDYTPSQPGFFRRVFMGAPPLDNNGNPMFRDNGEWGSYVGEQDKDTGHRSGKGTINYQNGAVYEGDFVNNKYEGNGVYTWEDGDKYEGGWQNGERHGSGKFTQSDGTVEIGRFVNGHVKGDGIELSSDYKNAWKLVDGKKTTKMLVDEAIMFAMEEFGISISDAPIKPTTNGIFTKETSIVKSSTNESSAKAPSTTVSSAKESTSDVVTAPKPGLFTRMLSKYDDDGNRMHKDHGEWGYWKGELDSNGKRTGKGIMTYQDSATYDGNIVNDKYNGFGTYTWPDGDAHEGEWENGQRHGVGIFRSHDGSVEYCLFENDSQIGEGIVWAADRKTAHRLEDGVKTDAISLVEAEKLSKELFDLPIPAYQKSAKAPVAGSDVMPTSQVVEEKNTAQISSEKSKVKPADEDETTMVVRTWLQSKLPTLNPNDLQEYSSQLHGDGFDSVEMLNRLEAEDLGFMKKAHKRVLLEVLLSDSKITVTKEKSRNSIPNNSTKSANDPIVSVPKASNETPTNEKEMPGIFARMFSKYDEDGNLMHKDNGEWGSWKGELDLNSKRTGKGTMSYEGGSIYSGEFSNDRYEGYGIFTWPDGDAYEGGWKDGKRQGVGVFRCTDGSIEYCGFENDAPKGKGIVWGADRRSAHILNDGVKAEEISLVEAEKLSKELFNLPIPPVAGSNTTSTSQVVEETKTAQNSSAVTQKKEEKRTLPEPKVNKAKLEVPSDEDGKTMTAKPTDDTPSQPGFFQRVFMGAPPLDNNGNPMFRDNGDWGYYVGDQDKNGHRSGKGKIIYQSGSIYEGGFVNNKYEGNGVYTWEDGDKYNGEWKDGERNGKGTFTKADGTVQMGKFIDGFMKGDGIELSADHKNAWKLKDGAKDAQITIGQAKALAMKDFGLSIPKASTAPTTSSRKGNPGILARMLSKYDDDGNRMHKDNGEWGSWNGELDSNGQRVGNGIMTYEVGAIYDGDFINDKYNGFGTYTWPDGDVYEGEWENGQRHGVGIYRCTDGSVEYCGFENDAPIGEGIGWSADRKTAHRLENGVKTDEISLVEAEKLSKESFDLPIPV